MRKISLFLLFSIYSLINYAQNAPKIRINPEQAYGGSISEYFDKIEYIPLESTKESLFGTASRLLVTKNSIVILDIDTYSLLFFELNGKFIIKHTIPKNIKYVTLDNILATNSIAINLSFDNEPETVEIRNYTENGVFLTKVKKHFKNGNIGSKIILDSDYYSWQLYDRIAIKDLSKSDTIPLIKIYNKNDELSKTFLPVHPIDYPFLFANKGGVTMSPATDGKTAFFVIPYNYGLYSLTKDNVEKIGQFEFPVKYLSKINQIKSKDWQILEKIGNNEMMSLNLIESVANISLYGKNILFTLQKKLTIRPLPGGSIIDPINFMYNTVTQKIISFEKLYPDSSSFFLPIMDGFSSINGMNHNGSYLYSTLSSLNMFAAKEATKSKNPNYPDALQNYFKTQTRKSNPIIVRMKLKE